MTFAIGALTVDGRLDAFVEAIASDGGERIWRPRFEALKGAVTAAGLLSAVVLLDDVYYAAVEGDWRMLDALVRDLRVALREPPYTLPPPIEAELQARAHGASSLEIAIARRLYARRFLTWRESRGRSPAAPILELRPPTPTGGPA